MGITIVHKSDLKRKHTHAPKALILAGGALTGGSFKAGGLKALNDYLVDFTVNDFDIFVGISSGSMIAASLIGGIRPETMLKSLDGTSGHFSQLTGWHCYRPNIAEMVVRPLKFIMQAASWLPDGLVKIARHAEWKRGLLGCVWNFITNPSLTTYDDLFDPIKDQLKEEDLPSLVALLPSGLFDNGPIEAYIRENIQRNKLTNDFCETFKLTKKRLYISAVRLDSAQRVVFGPDEDSSVSISQAIQASTALPGFYRPAHINGIDYVDGGVQETANIDTAIEKGAELVVCYNPFRPYEPGEFVEGFKRRRRRRLAADGVMAVLNQIFRAFFHTRLQVALNRFKRDANFSGDIILIEPRADDAAFFALNPMSLKNRIEAARLGFESVCSSIDERFDELKSIMARYGIGMSRRRVEEEYQQLLQPDLTNREVQRLLEGRRAKKARKKVRAAPKKRRAR
ncbi:MAG: patatin-like phospholipase family protein [Pseudomonadota bacterium]